MMALMKEKEAMVAQRVKDKVAVVTGAGSGIGRVAALRLAEHGAEGMSAYSTSYYRNRNFY